MKYILLLLLSYSFQASAQKIDTDKIDDFNGKRTISTGLVIIGDEMEIITVYGIIQKEDTVYSLSIAKMATSGTSTDYKSGVIFKLDDGKTLALQNAAAPDYYPEGKYVWISAYLKDPIISELLNKKVDKVRISTKSGNLDFEIAKKKMDAISKAISLVIERSKIPYQNKK